MASRSRDYFLCVASVVVPSLAILLLLNYQENMKTLVSLPELRNIVMPDVSYNVIKVIAFATVTFSYFAFFATVFK